MGLTRKYVRVSGRVQGVGFRWFALEAARRAAVTGWARNLRDGTVEAEVQGQGRNVEAFLTELRQGPPLAHVESIEERTLPPTEGETRFEVR